MSIKTNDGQKMLKDKLFLPSFPIVKFGYIGIFVRVIEGLLSLFSKTLKLNFLIRFLLVLT